MRYVAVLLVMLALGVLYVGLSFAALHGTSLSSATATPQKQPPTATEAPLGTSAAAAAAPAAWVTEAAKRLPEPNDLMGSAGAALISTIASELKLKKAELDGVAFTLLKSTAAVAMELNATRTELRETQQALELMRMRTAALETSWIGRGGEVACAFGHRCNNYIEAGERNLSSVVSVSACYDFCSRNARAPFFAFHNEWGMVHFLLHPKGRCRCYDNVPCDLVSDSGYNLWSTALSRPSAEACPAEVPPRLRGEPEPEPPQQENAAPEQAAAKEAETRAEAQAETPIETQAKSETQAETQVEKQADTQAGTQAGTQASSTQALDAAAINSSSSSPLQEADHSDAMREIESPTL